MLAAGGPPGGALRPALLLALLRIALLGGAPLHGAAASAQSLADAGAAADPGNASAGNASTGNASAGGAVGEEEARAQRLRELTAQREASEAAAKVAEAKVGSQAAELRNLSSRLRASSDELQDLTWDLEDSRRRSANLEASLKLKKADYIQNWTDALPHQKALAAAGGVLGALSIFGPSSYTRPFLALAGSAVAGLLVASASSVAWTDSQGSAAQNLMWLDSALLLLGGNSDKPWYYVWAAAVFLGVLRYCLQVDRRPHDVYWPTSGCHCFGCCRRHGKVSSAPSPPQPPDLSPAREVRHPAGGPSAGTPSTQAPFDNTPAFSMNSRSPRSPGLPPLAPAPPLSSDLPVRR